MINFKYFTLALAMLAGMGISQALAADPATPATPAANTNQAGGTSSAPGSATNTAPAAPVAPVSTTNAAANPNENVIVLQLADGNVVIQLLPEKAPEHVKRIKELVREGFYDGVVFHRVIDGFMAQTGDPSGTGMGKSKKPDLKAEFNDVQHQKGIVSMARASDPNSANSQFFIMLADVPSLNGQYTVFGKVLSGMEAVDKIRKGDRNDNGKVINPDKIVSMKVAADVPGFSLPAAASTQPAQVPAGQAQAK
jgi:cyclophilin family peptidyl-prolyl cis-trans isomerase